MLQADDLIRVSYDDSLTEAGVAYARQSLHYTYDRMSLQPYPRLRSIVTGVAVELAFRRWLEAQDVGYQLLGATHFTQPDHYDILLGGRRCDLKSYLVSDREKIRALRRDPGYLLNAHALVPLDQHNSDRLGPDDLYLFGFLAGLETRRRAELARVLAENQRRYLIHVLSQPEWSRPARWDPLGRLALKSNASRTFTVEVGGQNAQREPHREQVTLPPRTRAQTRLDYYSLLYLHLADPPDGALGVFSPGLGQTLIIQPEQWDNIWVYGVEVVLAGWLSKRDFHRRSRVLPAGERTLLYHQTRTHNRALPVQQLRPINDLIRLLRESGWA